jgi:hypothetical protein
MLLPELNSLTLKLEAGRSSENSEHIKYIAWYENQKYDRLLNNNRHKDNNCMV